MKIHADLKDLYLMSELGKQMLMSTAQPLQAHCTRVCAGMCKLILTLAAI